MIRDTADAKEALAKYGAFLEDIEIIKGTMDDVFLSVTGQKTSVGGESDEEE